MQRGPFVPVLIASAVSVIVPPDLIRAGLIWAGRASAQSEGVLGQDDAAFARALFQAGYPDLSQGVCDLILAAEAKGEAKFGEVLEVQALSFDLRLYELRREEDLVVRKDKIKAILDDANAFISENSRTKVADIVRTNIPSAYLDYATTLTAALERETDAAKASEMRAQGQSVFDEAKQAFSQRAERFSKDLEESLGNLDYAASQHELALFNLARMSYLQSLLFSPGAPEKAEVLDRALETFQDLAFDYGQSLRAYQGVIYQGLCHEALGDAEAALQDYVDAFALRELYEPNESGQYEVSAEEADIVSGATLRRMELLTELTRPKEAIEAADEYLTTIPDPLAASSGPKVLIAKAEAALAANDIAGAGTAAQQLIDFDPEGAIGREGQRILSRLPVLGLGADRMLRVAETSYSRGELKRALDLCRMSREAAAGRTDEQDIGSQSFFLSGAIYRQLDKLHEATLAFDLSAELYPKGYRAPEALNSAANVYSELAKKEKSRFYGKRADERMESLATSYPESVLATNAKMWEGRKRLNDGEFAGAIEFYRTIPASATSFPEASYWVANALHQQAKELAQQKSREAATVLKSAEAQYQQSLDVIQKAIAATLDVAVQLRLEGFAFSVRTELATLWLEHGRADEVQALLEGLEEKVANQPERAASLLSLRILAFLAEGRIDEAIELFEALIKQNPGAPGIAGAAGVLARALDSAGLEAQARSAAPEADAFFRKAAHYYVFSVRDQLAGDASLRTEEVTEIAQRLYVLGLLFNDVPEGQETFVDWNQVPTDPSLWEQAAQVFDRLDEQAPDYRVAIERARTYGILRRLAEAEEIYARLFDQYSLFGSDATSKRFDPKKLEARPELFPAYLEWGVCTHLVGVEQKDDKRLDRAMDIYERMLANTNESSRSWWQAKYFQIQLLSDRGDYDSADKAVRSVKRTTSTEFDKGQFGFADKFKALEAELSQKVFKKR